MQTPKYMEHGAQLCQRDVYAFVKNIAWTLGAECTTLRGGGTVHHCFS